MFIKNTKSFIGEHGENVVWNGDRLLLRDMDYDRNKQNDYEPFLLKMSDMLILKSLYRWFNAGLHYLHC